MKRIEQAFTLAEGATHVDTCNNTRKIAFTLAEVLITLGVIGVVAAITMPILITNMTERKNSERHANIAYKVTQAMEHMRATGKLVQYDSTESFVNELKKHLKITKICDSDHIAECWPTDKITMSDGEELEVSKAKTGKNLSLSTETNNAGLILADGATIILNYNPQIPGMDVGDRVKASNKDLPVGNGKMKNFAYTSTVTDSIDFVMDVNGGNKPNSEVNTKNRDIRSFKLAQFNKGGPDCSIYPNSFEVPEVGCVVIKCTAPSSKAPTWNSAKSQCINSNGMHLPDDSELNRMYSFKCNGNNADTCVSRVPIMGDWWSATQSISTHAHRKNFSSGGMSDAPKSSTGSIGFMCVGN